MHTACASRSGTFYKARCTSSQGQPRVLHKNSLQGHIYLPQTKQKPVQLESQHGTYRWKSAEWFRRLSYSKQTDAVQEQNATHATLLVLYKRRNRLRERGGSSSAKLRRAHRNTRACTRVLTHAAPGLRPALGWAGLMFTPGHVLECWGHRSPPLFAGYIRKTTAQARCWGGDLPARPHRITC